MRPRSSSRVQAAGAQTASTNYPNKPLRLVAPFSTGGALDLIARSVGQKISDGLGRPVIVDNKAGASGAIGSEFVARAAPDGYTLLLGATPVGSSPAELAAHVRGELARWGKVIKAGNIAPE